MLFFPFGPRDKLIPRQSWTEGVIPSPNTVWYVSFLSGRCLACLPPGGSLWTTLLVDLMPNPLYCRVQLLSQRTSAFCFPDHPVLEPGLIVSFIITYGLLGNLLEDVHGYNVKGNAQLSMRKVIEDMIYEDQSSERSER